MDDTQIEQIIKDNDHLLDNGDKLFDFVSNYINDTRELTNLEDFIGEFIDNSMPIYNADIMDDWHKLDDCHGATMDAIGEYNGDDIYSMMRSDLYYYYDSLLLADYNKLLELL